MKQLFIFISIIILISCGSSKKNTLFSSKDCSLERLEYQEITDTIHLTKNGNLTGGVSVNGKAIVSDKIDLDSVKAYLKAGNKVFISQTTYKTVKVSQEFYEKYTNNRTYLCQTMEAMKSDEVSSETKARAEKIYLDIIEMNSGLSEKKTPNVMK